MQKTNTAFQTSLYEKVVKQDNTVTQRGLEPRTLSLSRGEVQRLILKATAIPIPLTLFFIVC